MAGRGRKKRAGPVSLVGRRTPRSNLTSVYRGGNRAQGTSNSKIPVGPNPNGQQARRVRQAKRGRR